MAFHDTIFPTDISYGSAGGPGFNTGLVVLDSGHEDANERWSSPRYSFDVSYGIRKQQQLYDLVKFFNARRGASATFRYSDRFDRTTAVDGVSAHAGDDQQIAIGDGAQDIFQVIKTYTEGGYTTTRTISKPVLSGFLIELDGTPTAAYALDDTTGVITFTVAPGAGVVITAGYEFHNHVRFGLDIDRQLMLELSKPFSGRVAEQIPIHEVVDARPVPEEFPYRGAKYIVLTGPLYAVTVAGAVVWDFLTSVGNDSCILPDPTNLDPGGPYFLIRNLGAQNLLVKDPASTTIATMATTVSKEIWLTVDAVGDKAWIAI